MLGGCDSRGVDYAGNAMAGAARIAPEQSIRSVEAARELQTCLLHCGTDEARAIIVEGIEAYRAKTTG